MLDLSAPLHSINYSEFNSFYDFYQYQNERNFGIYERSISSCLSIIASIISSFTVYIIASCEKIDHLYRRTIIEHIVTSTLLSFFFPVTGFQIIANYSVIMTGTEFFLRVIVIAYGLTTSVALVVVALKSFPWYSLPRIGEIMTLDPRFYKITLDKSINILIITNGMFYIIVGLIVNCVGFIPFSVISITGHYFYVKSKKHRHSTIVWKQQKLIIRMEAFYLAIIFLCYVPSFLTLFFSLPIQMLPNYMKKLPTTLLISVPLQLFPIFDCLLNIFMITVYRQKGYLLFKNAITGLLEAQKRRRSSINPEKI